MNDLIQQLTKVKSYIMTNKHNTYVAEIKQDCDRYIEVIDEAVRVIKELEKRIHTCANCLYYNGDIEDITAFCDEKETDVRNDFSCYRYIRKEY